MLVDKQQWRERGSSGVEGPCVLAYSMAAHEMAAADAILKEAANASGQAKKLLDVRAKNYDFVAAAAARLQNVALQEAVPAPSEEDSRWRSVGCAEEEDGEVGEERIQIGSWNLLAQPLLMQHTELYSEQLKSGVSNWAHRKRRTMEEIVKADCDVLCLQELERSFLPDLTTKLGSRQYGAVFAGCSGDRRTDGCGVLYDESRFVKVEACELKLDVEAKPNACAIAVLDDPTSKLTLIVASAHLLFNPRRGDVRLRQTAFILAHLERLVKKHEKDRRRSVAVVFGADLNSTPASAVYDLLATGAVNRSNAHVPFETFQNEMAHQSTEHVHLPKGHAGAHTCGLWSFASTCPRDHPEALAHPFQFASAYADPIVEEKHLAGEPAFTTYIDNGTKGCVDYIFFSDGLLDLKARREMPLYAKRTVLPTSEWPSDHHMLLASFAPKSAPNNNEPGAFYQ